MAILASKQHTVADTKRWTVSYDKWLANTAKIQQIDVQSDSNTCTVGAIEILGNDVTFLLSGGTLNERVNLALVMTDDRGNIKHDSIAFTCIAP